VLRLRGYRNTVLYDARRFEGLIEPHLDLLFRAAFRLTRNEADAQDLVQETCVRACQRISSLDESCHVKAWLLRVLHNLFVDGFRRTQRSPIVYSDHVADGVTSIPCTDPNPEESASASESEMELQRAWLKLERDQRVLFALRAEGYKPFEIADITGVDKDALYSRLYRARASFAQYLDIERANDPENRKELTK
jgi:RNA polymerase sigma-70 factor (ECF subfamily)